MYFVCFKVRPGGTQRKAYTPKIYLPPIGIRLVKKYIGLDFKRMSLAGDAEEQRTLNRALNSTFNLNKSKLANLSEGSNVTRRYETLSNTPGAITDVNGITKVPPYKHIGDDKDLGQQESTEKTVLSVSVNNEMTEDKFAKNTSTLPHVYVYDALVSDGVQQNHRTGEANSPIDSERDVLFDNTGNNQIESVVDKESEKDLLETPYNQVERRSSRSTFRKRSSARPVNKKSALSEYNMEVIGLSNHKKGNGKCITKSGKDKLAKFYLDYGDGKLHDNLQIPKIKDCTRTWCNPHCKTCQLRTTGRTCFILVPVDELGRKRKMPVDERLSKLMSFNKRNDSPASSNDIGDQKEDNAEDTINNADDYTDIHITALKAKTNNEENEEIFNYVDNEDQDDNDLEELIKNDIEIGEEFSESKSMRQYLKQRRESRIREKRYSKKRLEELAQPRGGAPAEVRFSKMTLRKEQEQLMETERTKALSKYEQDNLSFIQGKISLFLALLNQQEKNKPQDMVHLPIREDLTERNVSVKKLKGIPWKRRLRNVSFSPTGRYRLMS